MKSLATDMDQVEVVELDGQQMTAQDAEDALRRRRDEVLQDMLAMRGRWMDYRRNSGVEERWRKSTLLYFGFDVAERRSFEETLKSGPRKPVGKKEPTRSKVKVNIIRPKVDQAVARLCEILLPLDGSNFGLDKTPVADAVAELVGDNRPTINPDTGQPTGFTADIEAKAIEEQAAESVRLHEKVIQDQLAECGYNGQIRIGMDDYCRLGSVVVEGPLPEARTLTRWLVDAGGARKVSERKVVPVSYRRDPWDVWFSPDCGNDHQRGGGYWSRRMVSRKELRALRDQPGYYAPDIDAILKESPTRVSQADSRVRTPADKDSSYELYIYHGEIEPEQYANCTCLNDYDGEEQPEVEFGIVMIVNDKMIGAMPSWVEDGKLPISVACYRPTDDTPYGLGIPLEQEDQQAVVTAAWRQLMDHGRYTVGTQFVVKRKGMTPATNPGSYEFEPNRTWLAGDEVDDVRKAMAAIDVPSHLSDYLAIVKAAMEYADMESNMPQIMSGSMNGNSHETLGGMELLFNNATTGLRHRVRTLDDGITVPQMNGYYDWNMDFHPDPKIKVEAKVIAKGATALLEKDIESKMTVQLIGLLQQPKYEQYIDPEKELGLILRAIKAKPESILRGTRELEERRKNPPQPQPDPKIVAAQMNMKAKEMDIADRDKQRQFEASRNDKELAFRAENLAYNSEREDKEYAISMTDMSIKRDLALTKLDAENLRSREGIIGKARLEALKIDAENQRFNAESALRVQTGAGI